jgi:hypothetical protein
MTQPHLPWSTFSHNKYEERLKHQFIEDELVFRKLDQLATNNGCFIIAYIRDSYEVVFIREGEDPEEVAKTLYSSVMHLSEDSSVKSLNGLEEKCKQLNDMKELMES